VVASLVNDLDALAGATVVALDDYHVIEGPENVAPPNTRPPAPGAHESLSEREAQVLRLLATDLTGPEIANRLSMSVNTLWTHTRHVFTKLDVKTRRAAVSRASDIELV
jgi:LuxR family maltose regulon positive regulatory protein